MKKLLPFLLSLLTLALPMSAAVGDKFQYAYPADASPEKPFSLGFHVLQRGLISSLYIPNPEKPRYYWDEQFLTSPVTLTYNITSDNTVEVVFEASYMDLVDIVIPDKVTDPATGAEYTVTTIGKMAFDDCPKIRSVIMPNTITRIEDYAFNMCENKSLHEGIGYIKFSDALTHIGNYAFRNCHNINTGYFIEGTPMTKSNSSYMYDGDQFPLIDLDDSGDLMSKDCKFYPPGIGKPGTFNYLNLPETVEYIGKHAFEGCYYEAEVNNKRYDAGITKLRIPNPACVIDDYAFAGCKFLELITIGGVLKANGLEPSTATAKKGRIGDYAFADCENLMRMDIPASIEKIGQNAFTNCFQKPNEVSPSSINDGWTCHQDLRWVYPRSLYNNDENYWGSISVQWASTLPPNPALKVDAAKAFLKSWHTNAVTIQSDGTEIGSNAFANCPLLAKVVINGKPAILAPETFVNCGNLSKVVIPEGTSLIPSRTFMNCASLDSVNLPASIVEIGDSAFYQCPKFKLTETSLPSGLKKINPYTFYGCKSLVIPGLPKEIESIGEYAFYGCHKLQEAIAIPNSVKSIGDYAFAECYVHEMTRDGVFTTGLKKVTIGSGVTSIGAHAFDGCRHLCQIEFAEAPSVTSIGEYAFLNCMSCPEEDCKAISRQKLTLPASLTSLGTGAFQGCSFMPTLEINAGLEALPDYAFAYCTSLESVSIPPTLTSISSSAFLGCSNLADLGSAGDEETRLVDGLYLSADGTEVISAIPGITEAEIPEGVVRIRNGAFAHCGSLTEVVFPESLEYIGSRAFEHCNALESITLPDAEMGDEVFYSCLGITQVTIPADFNRPINGNWFERCLNMNYIEVEEGNSTYASYEGLLYTPDFTTLHRAPSAIEPDPDKGIIVFHEDLTKIGDYAFSNCTRLSSMVIPETVTHIGAHAFDGCWWDEEGSGLAEIIFCNPAVTIGEYAFNGCEGLAGVFWEGEAPEGQVGSIGSHAFNGCHSLENLYLDYSVVSSLGAYAFAGLPGLVEIELPASLETIGDHAFYDCSNLTSVVFSEGLKTIGNSAFQSTPITSLDLPGSVKTIGNSAFQSTPITSLDLPDSIEEIGDSAFMNCSKVMAIKLPANLKNIKPYTFYNCFSDLPFKEDPGEDFKLAIKIPDAVESIGEYAFYGCDFMESEKELNSSSFDYYAYVYSLGLSEVSIGNGVKTIGDHAFDGCRHLVKVDMAPSVTSIGQYAFNDCFAESAYSAIKEKRDRSGKPVAGVKVEELWKRDLNPDSITLPDSLTTLGEAAFSGCALLPGINFPDGLTQIPAYAFDGCRSLPLLRLGDGVTTIGPSAFDGCTGVTEIHIPATLTNASRAFVDCEKALTVYYYASEPWEHFDEAFFSPKVYASEEATLIAKAAPISVLKQTSPWALFHIIDASDQTLEHNVGALQPTDNLRFRVLSNTPHRYCEVAGPYQEASSYVIPEKVLNINEDDPTNYGQYYTVIRIGNDAFENNLDLTEITIPATVIEIGQEAFNGCQNLTTINYAEDGLYITNMGERAFADCDALTYFKVPKGVTRLNTEVLKDCRGLLTIEMHPGVTELGKGALMDCRHLREFKYADGWNLEIIDDYALKNCIELTAVNIPYGVTKIGNEAFYYCQKLLKANLPSTLTEIGENAFENCEVLETINMFNVGDSIPELTGNPGLKNPLCRIYVQHTSLDAYRQAFPMLSHRILSAISIVPPASNKLRFVPDTPLELELIKNVPHTSLTWSSSNDEFVPVASGEGDAIYLKGVGITTVTVETDKHLYANYFNHECELKVYPQRADANWDGAFDISDAVNIAYYVVKNDDELINAFSTRTDMNEEEWNDFYYEGANLNGDRHISFADASAAMKEVLNQNPDGALTPGRSAGADPDADALIVGTNMTAADGGAMMIPVGLDSRTELVALQANIRVPEGIALVDVAAGEGAAGHTLSSRRIDSRTMRVILFDLSNSTFAADGSPLLRLTVKGGEIGPDDIEISGIVASDITSRSHQLIARPGQVIPTPTGVDKVSADDDTEALSPGAISASADGIVITASRGSKVMVCTVDGRVVRSLTTSSGSESISLPKGIYLVSVNGSATKIAVK